MDDDKMMYIYGCTHPPGKASPEDVKVLCDEMTQEELDGLDLTGVPITLDHPPINMHVKDTPELVCGKVLQMTRGEKGSKYILAWISAKTPAGEEAYRRLLNGELGLSLGHQYTERRYARTKELHSRSFAPDHVSLCKTPRRDGCWIGSAGFRRAQPYLKQPPHISAHGTAHASDSSRSTPPQQIAAQTAALVPATPMTDPVAAAPQAAFAAPAQAPSPMDTGSTSQPIPADWSRAQMHQDLLAAAATMQTLQENEARMAAQLDENQKQMEALATAKAQLEKERDEQQARQKQIEEQKAQKYLKAIAEASRGLKKMGTMAGDNKTGITEDGLRKALFPNGFTQEGVEALEEFHMVACAARERDEAVRQCEELRKQMFMPDLGNKRPRMETPQLQQPFSHPATMQPSQPASAPTSTSPQFQALFQRQPFGARNMQQPPPRYGQPQQHQQRQYNEMNDIPGGYVPIGATSAR